MAFFPCNTVQSGGKTAEYLKLVASKSLSPSGNPSITLTEDADIAIFWSDRGGYYNCYCTDITINGVSVPPEKRSTTGPSYFAYAWNLDLHSGDNITTIYNGYQDSKVLWVFSTKKPD